MNNNTPEADHPYEEWDINDLRDEICYRGEELDEMRRKTGLEDLSYALEDYTSFKKSELIRKLRGFDNEIAELSSRNETRGVVAGLTERAQALLADMTKLAEGVNDAEVLIVSASSDCGESVSMVAELRNRIDDISRSLEAGDELFEALWQEKGACEGSSPELDEALSVLQQQREDCRTRLDMLRGVGSLLHAVLTELEAERASQEKEQELNARLQESEQQHQKHIAELEKRLEEELSAAEQKHRDELAARDRAHGEEIERLDAQQRRELEGVKSTLALKEQELSLKGASDEAMKGTVRQLTADLVDREAKLEMSKMQSERDKSRIEQLTNELLAARAEAAQGAKDAGELENLRRNLASGGEQVQRLQDECKDLRAEKSRLESRLAEADALREQLRAEQKRSQKLEQQLAEADALRHRLSAEQSRSRELEKKLAAAESRVDEISRRLTALKDVPHTLRNADDRAGRDTAQRGTFRTATSAPPADRKKAGASLLSSLFAIDNDKPAPKADTRKPKRPSGGGLDDLLGGAFRE